jgi:hypothetical protein
LNIAEVVPEKVTSMAQNRSETFWAEVLFIDETDKESASKKPKRSIFSEFCY